MNLDDAVLLALKCLSKVLEEKIDAQKIRMAVVPNSTRKFAKLTQEDVEKHLKRLDSSKKAVSK